jgi:hypothetical protein
MHLPAQFARAQLNIFGLSFFLLLAPAFAFAGSQTYSTPGTYTFTVPPYATLTTTVNGAGGGGAGGGDDAITFSSSSGTNGSNGGNSSFNTTVAGYGGTGGTAGTVNQDDGSIQNGSNGSAGTASGGDSNTTGGGSGGGTGGTGYGGSENGGAGGAGGNAVKTYSSGALSTGASVTVVVGGAGSGGAAAYPGYSTAGASGSDGSVSITWTSPPTVTLTANGQYPSLTVAQGSSYTVAWNSTNASSCTMSWTGNSAGQGWTLSGSGGSGLIGYYTFTCTGSGGSSASKTVTISAAPLPTATISANSTSINVGQSTNLTATFAAGSGDSLTANAIDYPKGTHLTTTSTGAKSYTFTPQSAGTYTFSARATTQYYPGWTTYASVTVTVGNPTPTCSVTLTPNSIAYGSSSTLTYSSTNATSFYINNIGYVGSSGSTVVGPSVTTDYSGSVSGPGGSGTCPASLTVNAPPSTTATIAASSTSIYVGQSTYVTADFIAGSGDTLTADNIDEPLGTGQGATTNPDASKTITFTPNAAGAYTFYARAQTQYYTSWTTYAQSSVTVTAAPQCSVSLSPSTVAQGQISTLQYSSSNATSFSIHNVGSLTPDTSGSTSVGPFSTTDYTGSATAGGVTNTCPATLIVSCTPTYSCSGQIIQHTDSSCNVTNVTTCIFPAFCSAGSNSSSCLYPAPQFNSSGGYTGHLQINPSILPEGSTTTVHWNISNVASCTVVGSNGDSWSATSGTKTSASILQRTTYTLQCTGLDGTSIHESVTVEVVPVFQER